MRGFDNFTVIVNARGHQHLIYKHAIAQIISRRPQYHLEGEPAPADLAMAIILDKILSKGYEPNGFTEEVGGKLYRYKLSF